MEDRELEKTYHMVIKGPFSELRLYKSNESIVQDEQAKIIKSFMELELEKIRLLEEDSNVRLDKS